MSEMNGTTTTSTISTFDENTSATFPRAVIVDNTVKEGMRDPGAEEGLIGCLLLDNRNIDAAIAEVDEKDFTDLRCAIAFRAIKSIWMKGSEDVTAVSVGDWCKSRPDIRELVDYLWLVRVEAQTVFPNEYRTHVRRILELANRRRLIDIGARIANQAVDTTITVESTVAAALACSRECASEWQDPMPLSAVDLPPFPLNALPGWLAEFCDATATEFQVPACMPAMLALGALSCAISRKVRVCPKPGYTEPTNLWVMVLMGPANRKSPVHSRVMLPIVKHEKKLAKAFNPAEKAGRKKVLEGRHKRALKQATDGDAMAEQEVIELGMQLARLDAEKAEKMIADDITPAMLGIKMAENNHRITIASDEASNFFAKFSGPDVTGDLDHILKYHSGTNDRVDRVSRESVFLDAPALTLILTGQTVVLETIRQHEARGLPARILCSIPESRLGWRETRPPEVPFIVHQRYMDNMTSILDLGWELDEHGEPTWKNLHLSPGALEAHYDWQEWIERSLRPNGALSNIAEWSGKLLGHTLRIAGALHAATYPSSPSNGQISEQTYRNAQRIAEYLIPHAQAMHDRMSERGTTHAACKDLLAFFRRAASSIITLREVNKRFFDRHPDALQAAVNKLCVHGYCRFVTIHSSEKGGRPSYSLAVNPLWLAAESEKK